MSEIDGFMKEALDEMRRLQGAMSAALEAIDARDRVTLAEDLLTGSEAALRVALALSKASLVMLP